MANILVIEDNDTMREGLVQIIKKMEHHPFNSNNAVDGLAIFQSEKIDFVITDLKMDELSGIEILKKMRQKDKDILVMIITGFGTIDTAVEAMKIGAFDFITKPFSPDVIRMKINKALEIRELTTENKHLTNITHYFQEKENQQFGSNQIIGNSGALKEILSTVQKVASSDSAVLISGESGTGKELIARALHFSSDRKDKPFIKVNCGALAEGILESELFGHEKGAFTGAIKKKLGRFELASNGTIFLDEIGDFSPNIQLKLLRVLQEQEFERVGGTETIKVNVRVISATNKNIREEIKKGTFREDLFYRLHIVPIHVPALRDRPEDIDILANFFIKKLNSKSKKEINGFSAEAMDMLVKYNWPGNIRELENIVEQAYVLCVGNTISHQDLPIYVQETPASQMRPMNDSQTDLNNALEHLEKDLIEKAYKKAHGVKAETARILGIKTSALYYKLEKYGLINKEDDKGFLDKIR